MRKRKYWNPKRLLRLLFPNFRRGKKHLLLLFFYPRPLCFYHCGALFLSFLLLSSFSSKGKKISLLRVQNFFLFPPLFIRGKEIRWRKRMRNEEGSSFLGKGFLLVIRNGTFLSSSGGILKEEEEEEERVQAWQIFSFHIIRPKKGRSLMTTEIKLFIPTSLAVKCWDH